MHAREPDWRRAYARERAPRFTQADEDGSAAANRARQHDETRAREAPFMENATPTPPRSKPPRPTAPAATGIFPTRPRAKKRSRADGFALIDARDFTTMPAGERWRPDA